MRKQTLTLNLFAAVNLLVLGGCTTLNEAANNIQTALSPTPVKDTLPQICQALKNNPVKANDQYVNKALSATGTVSRIDEISLFQPTYLVLLKAGKGIYIHAKVENKLAVQGLSIGKTANVTGVITNLSSVDVTRDCSITLKNPKF